MCQSLYLNNVAACNFIKKDTLEQVFPYEFCEISKNTLFYRTSLVAASGVSRGELIQLPLVIKTTVFVEPTEPGSAWEKF